MGLSLHMCLSGMPSVWDVICSESQTVLTPPRKLNDQSLLARNVRHFPYLFVSLGGCHLSFYHIQG